MDNVFFMAGFKKGCLFPAYITVLESGLFFMQTEEIMKSM